MEIPHCKLKARPSIRLAFEGIRTSEYYECCDGFLRSDDGVAFGIRHPPQVSNTSGVRLKFKHRRLIGRYRPEPDPVNKMFDLPVAIYRHRPEEEIRLVRGFYFSLMYDADRILIQCGFNESLPPAERTVLESVLA